MKVVFLNNSYPIPTRTQKIYNSLLRIFKDDVDVKFIAWDRMNYNKTDKQNYIYSSQEGYGNKMRKIFGIFKFGRYSKDIIINEDPDIIITRQWDMFILAKLITKNRKIIYDVCDMPSSSNKLLHFIIDKLEKYYLSSKDDSIIFASRFFVGNYKKVHANKITLENKIDLLNCTPVGKQLKKNKKNKLSVAFIGAIRYFETLKNLIDAAAELDVELNFYGVGSDSNQLKNYCLSKSNINIYGRFNYNEINKFYMDNDIIWAAYPYKDLNVKQAISNKHFEAVFFSKPCIYSINTELGEYCEINKLGYTVDPYEIEDIRNLLVGIINDSSIIESSIKSIEKYKRSNNILWKDYDDDIQLFIENLNKK